MKLSETEHLKLQYVNNIQITTSHINNINDSDTDSSEKITEILNIYEEKTQILKANHHSKNGVIIVADDDTALLNADKNNKITKINTKIQRTQLIFSSIHDK